MTRRRFIAIACVCLCAWGRACFAPEAGIVLAQAARTPAAGLPGEVFTLNRCYELALAQSEQEKIRAEELAMAEARYRQSVAGFYPQFGLFARGYAQNYSSGSSGSGSTGSTASAGSSGGAGATGGGLSGSSGSGDSVQAGAYLRVPLFTGFSTFRESRARKHDIAGAKLGRERFRELLYNDLAAVFYQALEYEQSESILKDEENAMRGRIGELAQRVRIGRSREGEILAARTELAEIRVERENNRALGAAARELLAFLVGRPAASLRLRDEQRLPAPGDLAAYLSATGERRDLLAGVEALRAERERYRAAGAGHWPQASVEGEYYLERRPGSPGDYRVGLSIVLPLFEGFAVSAARDEARARLRGSELELDRLRRAVDYETRLAYGDFVSASARVLLLEEAVRLARAAYYVQARDYGLGIVSNLEVNDALRRFHQVRRGLVRAQMEARIHAIRLHVAAGRPVEAAREDGSG